MRIRRWWQLPWAERQVLQHASWPMWASEHFYVTTLLQSRTLRRSLEGYTSEGWSDSWVQLRALFIFTKTWPNICATAHIHLCTALCSPWLLDRCCKKGLTNVFFRGNNPTYIVMVLWHMYTRPASGLCVSAAGTCIETGSTVGDTALASKRCEVIH